VKLGEHGKKKVSKGILCTGAERPGIGYAWIYEKKGDEPAAGNPNGKKNAKSNRVAGGKKFLTRAGKLKLDNPCFQQKQGGGGGKVRSKGLTKQRTKEKLHARTKEEKKSQT